MKKIILTLGVIALVAGGYFYFSQEEAEEPEIEKTEEPEPEELKEKEKPEDPNDKSDDYILDKGLLIYPGAEFIKQKDYIEILKINYYVTEDSVDEVVDFYKRELKRLTSFNKEDDFRDYGFFYQLFNPDTEKFLEIVESRDISEKERQEKIEEMKREKEILFGEISIEDGSFLEGETFDGKDISDKTLIGIIFLHLADLLDMDRWWE